MTQVLEVADKRVKLTNLDKVFWPEGGFTKGDLIDYYIKIAPLLLKYLQDRPVSMVPYPDGIRGHSFYQKNLPRKRPEWLQAVPLYSSGSKRDINWLVVKDLPSLIWLANRGSIEVHPWFSRYDTPDHPDYAVFDLDPAQGIDFEEILDLALIIRQILNELGLKSYPKTSGQQGLHVYLPLIRKYNYTRVRAFLERITELIIKEHPQLATASWHRNKREGRIYIDYRQNARGKTLAAPYSLRPTEVAGVSMPLTWDQIEDKAVRPEDFRLDNLFQFLQEKDPFEEVLSRKQELPEFF